MDVLIVEVAYPSQRNGWIDPGEVLLQVNGTSLVEHWGHRDLAGLTPRELPPNRHLIGEPHADLSVDGRAAVLVCPLCGDLGCGAILARIEIGSDVVVWHDFIYGNNYDPTADEPLDARFHFDRRDYDATLRRATSA